MSQLSPGENYNIMPYSEYKEKKLLASLVSVKSQQRVPASDVLLPSKRKRSLEYVKELLKYMTYCYILYYLCMVFILATFERK